MITASQVLDRIKGSGTMQTALTGARAAVVGMVFAAAVVIGRGCEYQWATPVIFFAALAALMRFKVDIAYIMKKYCFFHDICFTFDLIYKSNEWGEE